MNPCYLATAVALALLGVGCATQPVRPADARPVKARRVLPEYALFSHPVPYGSKVVVVRDRARLDGFLRADLSVDGHAVAVLRPGERLDLFVYAGDHVLGLESSPGFAEIPDIYHTYSFRPGDAYELRIGVFHHALDINPANQVR
jgi:hypothetical protein